MKWAGFALTITGVWVLAVTTLVLAAGGKPKPRPVSRHIVFSARFAAETGKALADAVRAADAQNYPYITITIDSPGGDVDAGIAAAAAVENARTLVVCVVRGTAASMAFYFLQSCDVRIMTPESRLMVHEPILVAEVSGPPGVWRAHLEDIEATAAIMLTHESSKLLISKQDLAARIKDGKDWWMAAPEALMVGAVDVVAEDAATGLRQLHFDLD